MGSTEDKIQQEWKQWWKCCVVNIKKLSNKKILALHFPLFCCKSIRKRKQGNKKKEGKVKGSKAIFYSMTVNKNIVHRSKVHLCTVVVWKKRIVLKAGSSILSALLPPPPLSCGYFKGLFLPSGWCRRSPVPMMPAPDRSTYEWARTH